nr:MAG TPA: hypothetical protein [Caudoviricetes sp.]
MLLFGLLVLRLLVWLMSVLLVLSSSSILFYS